MKTRVLGISASLVGFGIVAFFVWDALRTDTPFRTDSAEMVPAAVTSEKFFEGQLEVQVFVLGNQKVLLEIQFEPADRSSLDLENLVPEVVFAMTSGHMDGFDPPLERLQPGVWRSTFAAPEVGRWIVSAGFGEEFAEVELDVK